MESYWNAFLAYFDQAGHCLVRGVGYTPCQDFWQTSGIALLVLGGFGGAWMLAFVFGRKRRDERRAARRERLAHRQRLIDEEERKKSLWVSEDRAATDLSQRELAGEIRRALDARGK